MPIEQPLKPVDSPKVPERRSKALNDPAKKGMSTSTLHTLAQALMGAILPIRGKDLGPKKKKRKTQRGGTNTKNNKSASLSKIEPPRSYPLPPVLHKIRGGLPNTSKTSHFSTGMN